MARLHILLALSVKLFGLFLASQLHGASGEGFLVERRGGLRASLEAGAFQGEISTAMDEALGCGGQVSKDHLVILKEALRPMWLALPKNALGRIERRSLRYLTYRYFNQRFALVVRGFEPSRPQNTSWGNADILSQRVPAFVESVLQSQHAEQTGFDLQDAAFMVATLEQLIFDSDAGLLDKVFKEQGKSQSFLLSSDGLANVLEAYLVHWTMGDDEEGIALLLRNKTLLHTAFPHWNHLAHLAQGEIRALQYQRERSPKSALAEPLRKGGNALNPKYSFDDAHTIVGSITRNFANFWESECISMKQALISMDTHHTGRVPLSRFYSSALETDWRFGESEAYLRELGALDETSWRGKQVIIPNYIQAASNCIVSTPHYMVCCIDDCASIRSEIEASVGAPTASPELLLAIVSNMTSVSSMEDEQRPQLKGKLTQQLYSIRDSQTGEVPLYGRLFAQWLHYVFPRECPFPHKTGIAAAKTPTEFGESYIATDEEMRSHAAAANASQIPAAIGKEELQWMSQWSEEEELLADHPSLQPSWLSKSAAAGGALLVAAVGLIGGLLGANKKGSHSHACLLPMHTKAHYV